MARQGRQGASGPGAHPSASSKASTSKAQPKSKSKGTVAKASKKGNSDINPNAPLDVYSYSSSLKKPRGDVDPESRPPKAQPKNKGKGRQRGSDDEEGSDLSEDEDEMILGGDGIVEFTGVRPEGLYMGGSDWEMESGGDEEIDSDEAYEDEDDLPLKPKAGKDGKKDSKAHRNRLPEIDLDEDEVDWDNEEGGAYMDASEMLDTGEFDSSEEEGYGSDGGKAPEIKLDSEEEMDQDSEDDVGSEEEVDSDEEEDSEYEGALDALSSFVDGLDSKKRKMDDAADDGGKKKKRVVLKERTEAFPEGEFAAVSAPEGVAESKVNLEDLLASFASSKNPKLAALRKTLKPLAAISSTSTSTSTSHSHLKTPGPLAAPLPARLQDKIEREAAYGKTKEETDKWNESVRRMKGESGLGVEGARHEKLSLPLMGAAGDVARDPNAAEWSAKFKPKNSLETSLAALLASSQMESTHLQKAETQALAALDPADVAARQAELRQQRDLMFRAERKSKRVAKIKSKAFRRIHRRAKGKDGETGLSIEEMAELDKIDGGDRVTEEKARMEITRARERATLKHSTKGGRWSQTVGGIEGLDEERNTAVREMVKREEELRRKIAGVEGSDDDDEFGSDGSEEDDEDASMDQIRRTAFDELASLDEKERIAKASGPKAKGVVGMKFMTDAVKRDERKVQGSADELRRKLEKMDEMGEEQSEDDEMESDEVVGTSEQVQGNLGRMVFGPSGHQMATATTPQPTASAPKSAEHSTKLSGPLAIASSSRALATRSPLSAADAEAESNPWLSLAADQPSSGKISRKMNKATVGKDSREASRSAAKVDKHKSKMVDAREIEKDDATVEIDPSVVLTKVKVAPQIVQSKEKKAGKKSVEGNAKLTMENGGADSSDEDDEEQHEAQRGKGPAAFAQRDLVARAFAGDNVVADFEAEKRREQERDAPTEVDNTLPGWGSWSGKGVKKAKNAKKFITKIAGIEPASRQDANYTNVIISEKKDKKASKYLLKDLPFPYTSAAQHEHKLRQPLGPEFSTATVLRDQTMPRILIKPGATIRPLSRANLM